MASASASRPKYGFSPVMSHIQAPSGASVSRSCARTAGSVRRDGVSATPTRSLRIISASCRASCAPTAASSRKRPLLPPTSTATSGRGRAASRARQASAAAASRAGVTRCSAVRVTSTLGPVRPSCRAATTRSNFAAGMRGCWTMTTLVCRRSAASTAADLPPQPTTSLGQRRRDARRRDGGERTRPPGRRHAAPEAARAQHADVRRQPRRLGQPQRLGAQPGVVLGQNPGA